MKKYPLVFKISVISKLNENGDNVNEVAKKAGIAPGTLLRWMNDEKLLVYYTRRSSSKPDLIVEDTGSDIITHDKEVDFEIKCEIDNKAIIIETKVIFKNHKS